jgi:hypothetical protein
MKKYFKIVYIFFLYHLIVLRNDIKLIIFLTIINIIIYHILIHFLGLKFFYWLIIFIMDLILIIIIKT